MSLLRKVAIVSRMRSACIYRLMLGALSYTETHPHLVAQDFFFPDDFSSLPGPEQDAAIKRLLERKPDGLLCTLEPEILNRLIACLAPGQQVVNMFASPSQPNLGVVVCSLATWFKVAVQHLRQQGLRSFAHLQLEVAPNYARSSRIFNEIVRPAEPELTCFHEIVKFTQLEDAYAPVAPVPAKLAAWLRQLPKPVGVVTTTVGGGGYIIRICRALGLRVPEDVAVVGVDDVDLALASQPTLTTVLPADLQIGRTAMELLDQMMGGRPAPADDLRIHAMDLHVRESTGLKRAEICDIAAALEYINRHACQGISVEQLMKDTQHVSKATFHKYFQAAAGLTPGEAILQRQMEEARRLLGETQLSITAIAGYCGFSDHSSFARSFRAAQKMSPGDYRRSHK